MVHSGENIVEVINTALQVWNQVVMLNKATVYTKYTFQRLMRTISRGALNSYLDIIELKNRKILLDCLDLIQD